MQFTAEELSLLLNGTVEGDPAVRVDKLAKIEDASAGSLTFLANPKYEPFLYTTGASIVLVNKEQELASPVGTTLIRVDNAYSAITVLLQKYEAAMEKRLGIEQYAFIHPSAVIGENTYIGAFAYVSANTKIGDNCKLYPGCYIGDETIIGNNVTLYPGVKVYHDCRLGNNVMIHAGAVIGSDGFGFAPSASGDYAKISQIGNVVIEDDVEIGANTTIDRATMGSTLIHKGVKLDNLIQVAHNVEIGANTVIAAQSGLSGSSRLGENCVLGGQVGLVGHISIANGTQFQAQSGLSRSIKEQGQKWAGTPAQPFNNHMRSQIVLQRLPDLEKKILALEKIVEELRK